MRLSHTAWILRSDNKRVRSTTPHETKKSGKEDFLLEKKTFIFVCWVREEKRMPAYVPFASFTGSLLKQPNLMCFVSTSAVRVLFVSIHVTNPVVFTVD